MPLTAIVLCEGCETAKNCTLVYRGADNLQGVCSLVFMDNKIGRSIVLCEIYWACDAIERKYIFLLLDVTMSNSRVR